MGWMKLNYQDNNYHFKNEHYNLHMLRKWELTQSNEMILHFPEEAIKLSPTESSRFDVFMRATGGRDADFTIDNANQTVTHNVGRKSLFAMNDGELAVETASVEA